MELATTQEKLHQAVQLKNEPSNFNTGSWAMGFKKLPRIESNSAQNSIIINYYINYKLSITMTKKKVIEIS
jgi:hypothetical protein